MEDKKKLDGKSVSRVLDEYIKKSGCKLNEISSSKIMGVMKSDKFEGEFHKETRRIKRILSILRSRTPYHLNFSGEVYLNDKQLIKSVYIVTYKDNSLPDFRGIPGYFDDGDDLQAHFTKEYNLTESTSLGLSKKVADKQREKDAVENLEMTKPSYKNTFDVYFEFDDETVIRKVDVGRRLLIVANREDISRNRGGKTKDELIDMFLTHHATNLTFDKAFDCRRWIKMIQTVFHNLWGIDANFDWHQLML